MESPNGKFGWRLLGSAAAGFRCCGVPLPGSAGKRARAKVGGTTESVEKFLGVLLIL